MNVATIVVLLYSLLLATVMEVYSFPTGAGGCMGGIAAVGGSHLGETDSRMVANSTLETGGVTVKIGNITLDSNTPLDLATSVNHTITITSVEFPVRGILIRVEADGVDASASLTPGLSTQIAMACVAPIVGTTHTDSSDKSELTSVIRFDENIENVILDITGVFVNGPDGSVYIYSRYLVNFGSTTPTTSVPSAAPTDNVEPTIVPTMVSVPTASPVAMESDLPSTAPVGVETAEPTIAPIDAETASPTLTPVDLETATPTTSPISVTDEPTESPLSAPTSTESPVPTYAEKTSEPSLRGGKGMGMMSKVNESPSPTKAPSGEKKGMMMKGMMMSGGGKGSKEAKDILKKSKDEDEAMDKKHSMAKLSKQDVKL